MLVGHDIPSGNCAICRPIGGLRVADVQPRQPVRPGEYGRGRMDAVGWTRWLTALGIPGLSATYYGRSMEHKGLVYIKIITVCNTTLVILRFLIYMSFRKAI